MIEGITVLNQTEVTDIPDWFGVLVIVILILGGLMLILGACGEAYVFSIIGMLMWISVCIGILAIDFPASGRYEYECVIDESVKFSNIYEHYEVIDQRGDIWILKEKEK